MVHSSCQGQFLPTPNHVDGIRPAIAAGSLLLCMLMPVGATEKVVPPERMGSDSGSFANPSGHLRIADLVEKEKRNRELELQRKLPMSALPAAVAQPKASESANLQRLTTRPVLWSLTGAKGNYQAEIVWQNRLHVISSDQASVPLLGTLEYMDETGVYIRPGRKQRVNKAWLDADGLLVLASPRDGQAAPILVEIPKNSISSAPAFNSAANLPSTLPLFLPQSALTGQAAPKILASGEVIPGNTESNAPKKIEPSVPTNPPLTMPPALAMHPKGAIPALDKSK